ncbi:MAG: MCE family protein [Verrucomicrobiota bacterium]|nr:MCE family protein [Verrucomicrobiota bacterium]
MKIKFSPALVGAFVLGACFLAVVGLLAFGGVSFFSQPQRFVVYFDESIHGLDLGSPVKLRGVRVGRVVDMSVRYDAEKNHAVVAVVCELNRNVITDEHGAPIDVSNRATLQNLIDHGLRAQLGVVGLATGLLFVELNFVDPHDYPQPENKVTDVKYAVVPSLPSAISEYQASLTEILSNLKKIDFAGMAVDVKRLLSDAEKQINGADVKGLIVQWREAGTAVKELASSPDAKQAFANLNAAIAELRGVLAKLDAQVTPAGENLEATLKEAQTALEHFNAAATGAQHFIEAQSWVGDEAARTLAQISEAAEAVRRLADFIERNPNALVVGKKPSP